MTLAVRQLRAVARAMLHCSKWHFIVQIEPFICLIRVHVIGAMLQCHLGPEEEKNMSSLKSAALMSLFTDVSVADVWRAACCGYRQNVSPLDVAYASRFVAPFQPSITKGCEEPALRSSRGLL